MIIQINHIKTKRDMVNWISPPIKTGKTSVWVLVGIQFQIKGIFVLSLIQGQATHLFPCATKTHQASAHAHVFWFHSDEFLLEYSFWIFLQKLSETFTTVLAYE